MTVRRRSGESGSARGGARPSGPTRALWVALTVAAGVALAAPLVAQHPDVDLQRAIQREETTGDLPAAIAAYERIAEAAATTHPAIAAQALLRQARTYEKAGDIARAQTVYQRIVRDFSNQPSAAEARLHVTSPSVAAGLRTERVVREESFNGVFWRVSSSGRVALKGMMSGTGGLALGLVDLASGETRQLTFTDPGENRHAAFAVFSPDERQAAYDWYSSETDHASLRVVATSVGSAARPRTLHDNPEITTYSPGDWSPDGQWIAVAIKRRDRTAQVGVVNTTDGALRVLETVPWTGVGGLRFSPDSTQLAFHAPAADGVFARDVFTIAVDGSRKRTAVSGPSDDSVVEWTPDGQLIVSSDRGGAVGLWMVSMSQGTPAGTPRLLKADVGNLLSLGLTRSGALFYRQQVPGADFHVADVDVASGRVSGSRQPVRMFRGFNAWPDWSPDGRALVFVSKRDVDAEPRPVLVIHALDSGTSRDLLPPMSYLNYPRWSPDGRRIAAVGTDLKGRSGIVTVDTSDGRAVLIADGDTCSGMPFWSASGRSIFCFHGETHHIVEIDAATGQQLRAYPGTGRGLAASPDGQYVVFVNPRGEAPALQLLTLATRGTRPLVRFDTPSSGLTGTGATTVSWTSDSRYVTFAGRMSGEAGAWFVSIADGSVRRIQGEGASGAAGVWRLHPTQPQVLFAPGGLPAVDVWKLDGFLSAPGVAGGG